MTTLKPTPAFRRGSLFIALGVLAMATLALPAYSQSYYGGVRGTVLDQNGGALTGAKVTLVNQGTNEQRAAVTGSAGDFVFSEVIPGTYSIAAEAPGFKKFEQKGIIVGTQQQVSVDAKLQVGQVTESIEVTEAVPLVEASNASQGQVLDNQKLTDLPNLGRNPFMLSKLAQNVVPGGQPGLQSHGRPERLFADLHRRRTGSRQQLPDRWRSDHRRHQSRHHHSLA